MVPSDDDDVLISAKEAAEILGISKRTFWRRLERPDAPQPIRQTYKTVRWSKAEIKLWIKAIREGE